MSLIIFKRFYCIISIKKNNKHRFHIYEEGATLNPQSSKRGKKKRGIIDVLKDPVRLEILANLFEREYSISELAKKLNLTPANIHYHIQFLLREGMIIQSRTELKGNILEKYYKTTLREEDISLKVKESNMTIQERKQIRLSMLWMGLWLMNKAIKILESASEEQFYPTGVNYISVPATVEVLEEVSAKFHKFEEEIAAIASKYSQIDSQAKLAIVAAIIPYE